MKRDHWFYNCAVCGRSFPFWWVSAEEWEAGGFGEKAVCKTCFEVRVPRPRYFTLDEYMSIAPSLEETTKTIIEAHPGIDRDIAERRAIDIMAEMYEELDEIWDHPGQKPG